jgi:RND family efflux transporter MFP subunit
MSTSRDSLAALRITRPEEGVKPGSSPRRPGRWIWGLLILLFIAGTGFALLRGYQPLKILGVENVKVSNWVPDAMKDRPKVNLVPITVQTGRSSEAVVVATGYLESRQQARIGARATGRLQSIHFEEGSKVKANDTLAVLEHADLDASLKAAEASIAITEASLAEQDVAIAQARNDLERAESLRKQRSIAEAEYDQARFALDAAMARHKSLAAQLELSKARLRESEQMKENMFIRAPFSGTVISKDAEIGESILPGGMGEASGRGSVATIADLDHLEVECDVKEDFIARVFPGQKTEIKVDAVPDKKYNGTVRKVIPMGDRARATIKVQVTIDDADRFLFPEMSGTVYFLPQQEVAAEIQNKTRFFCPATAVSNDSLNGAALWRVNADGRAEKFFVQVGEARDGKIEILSGVEGNERVITDPKSIQEGQPVAVIE